MTAGPWPVVDPPGASVGDGDAPALGPEELTAGGGDGETVVTVVGATVGGVDGEAVGCAIEGWLVRDVGVAVGRGVGFAVGLGVGLGVGLAFGVGPAFGVGRDVGVGVTAARTTIVPNICSGWIWQK